MTHDQALQAVDDLLKAIVNSDVDVLVEFQAGHVRGFNFVSIEREFSGLSHGRRVEW